MGLVFKVKRGPTLLIQEYTGPEGALSYDVILKKLYIHDGETQGGKLVGLSDEEVQQLINLSLDGKVDKVNGKGLSTNDYTGTEKIKLSGIENGATRNDSDANLRNRATHTGLQAINTVAGLQDALDAKVAAVAGKGLSSVDYTAEDKAKLDGIVVGATKNDTDANLKNRANHTGTQAIATVNGLQAALDGKVAAVTGKQLSTEDYSTAEKNKLGGIAANATANQTDAYLLARANHTGTQAIATVSGLQAALDAKVAAVTGKGLSTNDFTDTLKSKLESLTADNGATDAYLLDRTNHTGTQAISTVDGLQAALDAKVAAVSGKQLSTEDYTSAEKTKLSGITAGATKNDTDANLKSRANHTGTQAIATVDGLQAALNAKSDTTAILENGQIKASLLPSFVDDVLEFQALSNFPTTGETGKIYIAVNSANAANPTRQYRWSGTAYTEINASPGTTDALVEGSNNRYFTVARVLATVLSGLSTSTGGSIVDTDSVLSAFGKIQAQLNAFTTAIGNKVDKVSGKQLSTEDYTSAEKSKLSGIAAGAQVNVATNLSLGTATATNQPVNSSTGSGLTLPAVTTSTAGLMTASDKSKLDGIAAGAQANVATNLALGTADSTTQPVTNNNGTGFTLPAATTSVAGLMSAADKTKLNGIAAGATANTPANLGLGTNGTATLVVTNSNGTGVTLPAVTTSTAGLMTSSDKAKLDGIAAGATNTPGTNLGTGTITSTAVPLTSSTGSGVTLPAATSSTAGVMVAADKSKLDGIAAGAQVNVATNIGLGTATSTGLPLTSSTGSGVTLPVATTSVAGLLSASDKAKLDGIAAGASANTPANLALGTRTTTTQPITNSNGTGITLPAATTALAGLMSSADKTKLDGIAAGATATAPTDLSLGTRNTTTQAINSSTGAGVTLPAATTSLAGLMSSADKTKVDSVGSMGQRNVFISTAAPTASDGVNGDIWLQYS